MTANQRFIILGCFFLSGAAGLIAEIVWMKMFGLVFGSTAWAVAVVLATFMAGLAVGSICVRTVNRRSSDFLKLYSIMEIGIGVNIVLTPFLFLAGENAYVSVVGSLGLTGLSLRIVQALTAAAVMLIPTALMGAVLPVLTWHFLRTDPEHGRVVGVLSGVNTMGAAFGAFSAAFCLIGTIGITRTLHFAAGLNLLSAAGVFGARLMMKDNQPAFQHADGAAPVNTVPDNKPGHHVILAAVFVTGVITLGCEVLWTRLLTSLCLGSSVYAFASMLTVILLGLVLGNMVYSVFIGGLRSEKAVAFFGILMIGLAVAICLGPRLAVWAGGSEIALWAWNGCQEGVPRNNTIVLSGLLGIPLIVLFFPAAILGTAFPLLADIFSREKRGSLSLFYAVNTLGGIAGAFIGTFVLLGKLGMCTGFQLLAEACIVAGTVVWFWGQGKTAYCPNRDSSISLGMTPLMRSNSLMKCHAELVEASRRRHFFDLGNTPKTLQLHRLATGVAAVCVMGLAGIFLAPHDYFVRQQGGVSDSPAQAGIVFDCEDADAWVSVRRSHDVEGRPDLNMFVNGRALSNTGFSARRYMKLMSHLPLLLHGNCRDSLVICFGTGMTFGSTTLYQLDSAECVEISRGVLRAADCFRDFNSDVARKTGLNAAGGELWRGESEKGTDLFIRLEDGRTHLLTTRSSYDLITLEPPHPRDCGSVNLYSSEFYRLCKKRLRPGGMVMQWIPLFQQSQDEIRREVKTFLGEFPCVSGWMPSKLNLLLIGSDVIPKLDVGKIRVMMESKDIRQDLADIGISNVRQLLDTFTATREALVEYAGNVPPLTDDVPAVEYYRRFGMDSLTMEQGATKLRECSAEENFPELRQEVAVINLR